MNTHKTRNTTFYYKRKGSGRCLGCSNPEEIGAESYCPVCKEKRSKGAQKRNLNRKKIVFEHYGQACAWANCDVTDLDLLTVDHVNNDGAEERKQSRTYVGGNSAFYKRIIDNKFPKSYQVLCWNHQWKKRMMVLRNEPLPTAKKGVGA